MAVLSSDHIVRGLTAGRGIAPFSLADEILDGIVDQIRADRTELDTQSEGTRRLWALLSDSLRYIHGDRLQALAACEIYLLPLPLSYAFCERIDGKSIIVVPSGFIDLVAHTICSSYFESLIPEPFDSFYLLDSRRDMSVHELVANALFLTRLQFYTHCTPMPNVRAFIFSEQLSLIHNAVSGAIMFAILHELGHLTLGHLENARPRPARYATAIAERLNQSQRQEIDADAFALDCLADEAKAMGTYWANHAVTFFTQMETVAGERHAEHPLFINRSFIADMLRDEWGRDFSVGSNPNHFEQLARRFRSTERETKRGNNRFVETPPDRTRLVLLETLLALQHYGFDLVRILEQPWAPWLELYEPIALAQG